MARRLIGNPPIDQSILVAQANGWAIYERTLLSTNEWRTIKVVSTKHVPHKANYHLGWHRTRKSLTGGKETKLLQKHVPGVHRWVCEVLSSDHFA